DQSVVALLVAEAAQRFIEWHAAIGRRPEVGHHVGNHDIVAAGSIGDAIALRRIDHRRLHVRHCHDLILMGRYEESSVERRSLRSIVHRDHSGSNARRAQDSREDHSPHRVPHSQPVQHSRGISRLIEHPPRAHRVQLQRVEQVDVGVGTDNIHVCLGHSLLLHAIDERRDDRVVEAVHIVDDDGVCVLVLHILQHASIGANPRRRLLAAVLNFMVI
ncbi:hypothetical protein PMAYCL1PPCAC_16033, partial [Pristionchus mayeri]